MWYVGYMNFIILTILILPYFNTYLLYLLPLSIQQSDLTRNKTNSKVKSNIQSITFITNKKRNKYQYSIQQKCKYQWHVSANSRPPVYLLRYLTLPTRWYQHNAVVIAAVVRYLTSLLWIYILTALTLQPICCKLIY